MNSNLNNLISLDKTDIYGSLMCNTEDLKNIIQNSDTNFTVLTQNIRSVYGNHDDLLLNLAELSCEVDILILTECRLDINKPIPILNNYSSHFTLRKLNQNDGVVAYIKNNQQVQVTEINLTHASAIQIMSANCTIIGIYRSPSVCNADNFIRSLTSHLETITSHNNVVIMGDININLIPESNEKSHKRNNRTNYLDLMALHGFQPGHQLPTRDKSCLDHVFLKLNKPKDSVLVAVLSASITDHSMVSLNISNIKKISTPSIKTKLVTDFEAAHKSLVNADISQLTICSDPNVLADLLIDLIKNAIQSYTTVKIVHSSRRILKPWINAGALRCIRLRNAMQLKLKRNSTNLVLKITYNRYRNYCTNLLRKLKRDYNKKQIENSTKNPS